MLNNVKDYTKLKYRLQKYLYKIVANKSQRIDFILKYRVLAKF